MSPAFPKLPSFSFRVFEAFFLISLAMFPLLFGATNLWGFCLGAAVLCSAFAAHWFVHLVRDGRVLKTELDPWVGLYLVFFLLSLAFSKIRYFSWIELFKLAVVLLAFIATRYVCRERRQIRRLAHTFVFLGGLLSAVGLLQFVGGFPKGWWSQENFLSSTYVNHNHFAGLLVLVLPIAFGSLLAERDRSKKVLFLFLSVLMGIAFVFTLSRGALVSLGVSMACMIVVLRKRGLISSALVPFLVFVVLVIGAVVVFGTESIEQRIENIRLMKEEEELSLRFRWLTWLGTLPMIRRFFWFGSGPGTFGHLFLPFRPEGGFTMRPVYAHNDFLHLFAECGVFTFLAASVLVVVFFREGLRVLRRDDSRLRIGVGSGAMAGVLGLLVHGLFDFNFHIPANWLLCAVAAGLVLSMDQDRFYRSAAAATALKTVISLALLAALPTAFYLGWSDYRLWEARNLLKQGQAQSALRSVEQGLRLNPFDAEFRYMHALVRLSEKPLSSEAVQSAVKDLDDAIRLNPYEPVYDLEKARALVPLLAGRSPDELVQLFENALAKDPNNPGLAYLVARSAFGRSRHSVFRESIAQMLTRRSESLSGLVDFLEKQDFWQYHRQYHLKLAGADPDATKRTSPADLWNRVPEAVWTLKDFSQKAGDPAVDEKGTWFKNAEFSKKINIRNPLSRIVLRAKGSPAKGVYPTLYVKIDGQLVDEYYMNSPSYRNYYTDLRLMPGEHLLSLEYVNDLCAGGLSREDRNVWVQRVSLLEA